MNISILEEKFRISARPSNILYIINEGDVYMVEGRFWRQEDIRRLNEHPRDMCFRILFAFKKVDLGPTARVFLVRD